MILLLIEEIFQDDVLSISTEIFRSELYFRILFLVEKRLLGVGPLEQLLIVKAEVFESLHMSNCKIELISTFLVRGVL
jgi:hypothetical protein